MNAEISLFGVYVPSLFFYAALAAMVVTAIALTLRALGLDRIVWHHSLFNAAAFVCLLGVAMQLLWESSP